MATTAYACWNYFQSMDSTENGRFVQAFKTRYGEDRVTDDVGKVREAVRGQSMVAPEGLVNVSSKNNHTGRRLE